MTSTIFTTVILASFVVSAYCGYKPTWESLDTRPLPPWYDDVKFGIFIHWGVFSVPSVGTGTSPAWFWYNWKVKEDKLAIEFMEKNYRPGFQYADFAPQFTAEFYDPEQWADIFEASGAKYVVLTSKHHEGFTNWPSNYSFNWNSMDVGPKRDLVGDLSKAIKNKKGMHFGLYHSLYEWFNQLYIMDQANGFTTRYFAEGKTMPELYELVMNYEPEVVWSDGDGGPWQYWKSPEFIAWLYNDSPVRDTVVVNDRWGYGVGCKHGDFWTCSDRFNPGHVMPHKWENCMTIDRYAWGFKRNAQLAEYLSIEELIKTLVETVSCGGNLLMNVGPTHDGRIVPIYEERLRQVGQWLKVNGEAIYGTKPWLHQNDTVTGHVWYTCKNNTSGATDVYAIALQWPTNGVLRLGAPVVSSQTEVTLLGYSAPFKYTQSTGGLLISIPTIPFYDMPCMWGWVFKLTNLKNL